MMEELISIFLKESERLRPGYTKSIRLNPKEVSTSSLLKEFPKLPPLIEKMYDVVSGTYYVVEDQKMMDFIPGFLLIHLDEYREALQTQNNVLRDYSNVEFFPLLRNYSSDFISLKSSTNEVYQIFHDDEPHLLHRNPRNFLNTLVENYIQGVYFLDNDGYLDYNEDLEMEVGRKNNPDVEFWQG